ncbi:MAG TPA: hypothetical protein VL326_01160 [Kofleriaceae bacterium]|nr:hypothetical protein [Kofleriaceae bacterium]
MIRLLSIAFVLVSAHPAEHLQSARDMQHAIADGRLLKARELAEWFAHHPLAEPIRGAALRIAKAPDVATAGGELGDFGKACAACHVASNAKVTFTYGPPPRELDDSVAAQMERHQWGATRLWEGLIGPSENEWLEGATVLAVNKIDVSKMARGKPNAGVVALGQRLQQQAREAQTLRGTNARAEFYGRMMSTCAACHQMVRPYPVSLDRKD